MSPCEVCGRTVPGEHILLLRVRSDEDGLKAVGVEGHACPACLDQVIEQKHITVDGLKIHE